MSKVKTLIPKGYSRIALRENRVGRWIVEIFYHEEDDTFFIKHTDIEQVMGPLTKGQLEDITEAIKDVMWASGSYNQIADPEED
jgi:DNA mismatch repair protein MutH